MDATPLAPPVAARRGARAGAFLRTRSVYVAFVVLVAIDLALTPGFASLYVVRSLLFEAAPIILIALGQSLAIGTRGIDLSVGSVMALGSAVTGISLGLGPVAACLLGIAAGLGAGIVNGALVALVGIDPLISSLALLVAARGLGRALLGGARIDLPDDGVFGFLGQSAVAFVPVVAIASLLIAVLVFLVVGRTAFGRRVLFVGASRPASALAGIPVNRTLFLVYGASGLFAGIAGLFASARLGAADANYIGVGFELDTIAAAVIGGTPLTGGRISIAGTVLGVLLLRVLDASFIMNDVNATWSEIIKAIFIIGALAFQRTRA